MKKNLIYGITGAVVLVGGVGAYLALAPSAQEKEATAAIKAGDYEDAVKIAKRGLVDQPGNRRLQGIFLAATALERAQSGDWVLGLPERYLANLNIVNVLSKANAIWENGSERDKAVEAAQEELRKIRQAFAALGLSIESIEDLKPIAKSASKFFQALKLDFDKKEVQRVSLVAAKIQLLLGDKDGTQLLLSACERAKGLDETERSYALVLLGFRDIQALRKIAFDSSHSLYGVARFALAQVVWNLPEYQAGLPKLAQAKPDKWLVNILREAGRNTDACLWFALMGDEKTTASFACWPWPMEQWISPSGTAGGSSDFGWSVPYLRQGDKVGIAAVAMIRKDKVEVVPLDALVPAEGTKIDGQFRFIRPDIDGDGSEQRIAIQVATREEQTTQYRDEYRYNPYLGGTTVKVPYQTTAKVPYWVLLTFNPSTKRMDRTGYRKGDKPFALDAQTLDALPPAPSTPQS